MIPHGDFERFIEYNKNKHGMILYDCVECREPVMLKPNMKCFVCSGGEIVINDNGWKLIGFRKLMGNTEKN